MDIREEATKIRHKYETDPRTKSYNAIVYGGLGSGKTASIRSCRTPILVHSFDPGGTKVLSGKADWSAYNTSIESGDILVDTSFEVDDPSKPVAFESWDTEYHRLKKLDFFSHLGTYAIDSITTWAQCAMNAVLKKAGRAGGVPQQNDWYPQMNMLELAIREFISLPCDCILIGHDAATKDEVTGKIFKDLMITGKLVRRVPLLFDEIYHAETKETSKGVEYQLLTRKNGTYQARSRLGKNGELELYEKPDIKNILRKVGYVYEDKPKI